MKSINFISRNTLIEIISALLLLLFLYTGASKLMDLTSFVISITKQPIEIIWQNARLIGYSIPVIELIIAIFLFFPRTRKIGFWASLVLMTLFTLYVGYMLLRHKTELPCTCGGVISKMSWPQHLIFNLIYTLIAAMGIWISRRQTKTNSNNFVNPAVT